MAAEATLSQELARIIGPLLIGEDGVLGAMTSQASLFLARDLTGKEVVLKRTTARSREQLDSAQNEVSLLRKIRHPNVVAFCGVWTKPLQPYGTEVNLLIELCPGGHLLDLQRRREAADRPLTEQELARIFVQCCRGVECLHRFDPPVAHRDVKLENFVLGGDDGRIVKLCDLGSATTRRTLVTTKEERVKLEDEILRLTTPCYRAPELVDLYSRKLVSEQVDVWALGCVLYALAFGKHAFGEEGSTLAILNGKFTIPAEPYYSSEFKLILIWLFESDPNIRPRIGDVVDELDMLLGNRVKVPAEKRRSGCGARAASKLPVLQEMLNPSRSSGAVPNASPPLSTRRIVQPSPTAQSSGGTQVARGAAFVTAVNTSIQTTREPGALSPLNRGMSPRGSTNSPKGTRSGAMESRRNGSGSAQPTQTKPSLLGGNGTPNNKPPPNPPKRKAGTVSNNPFDDLPPSLDPTFYSTPGMRSTSVVGFPDEFLQSDVGTPFDLPAQAFVQSHSQMSFFNVPSQSFHTLPSTGSTATNLGTAGALNPSQAPIFFSDPPPQWRQGPDTH